jgi:AcrR family transcriptional regulator
MAHARQTEGGRPRLSRERLMDAAIRLADAGGIGQLSMRRLAQELGVEAMSLYYHVANKDDLMNGIADRVVGEIELPAADAAWKPALRRLALSAYEAFTRHPWAASLVLSGAGTTPARVRYMEAVLGTLRRAGFSAGMTDHGYHAIESHIMGFTLWEVGMNLGTRDDLARLATGFLESLPARQFPHIEEHIRWHLQPADPSDEGEFAFGLDLILDGLERMLPRRTSDARAPRAR